MTIEYYGPFIYIRFKANELSEGHTRVKLADGYTYERIVIHHLTNISELHPYQTVRVGDKITFPPCILYLFIPDITKMLKLDYQLKNLDKYLMNIILVRLLLLF